MKRPTTRTTLVTAVTAVLLALAACESRPAESTGGSNSGPRPPQGYAWVIFGADTVRAEVADTPEKQQQGLMFRDELDAGSGMLFVFDAETIQSFWMRDTHVPLDIAFLDRALVVVDIQQMEPMTEDLHRSAAPAMFALEVPEGWFEQEGIEPGQLARMVFGRR
jgi:uncharacterized protein